MIRHWQLHLELRRRRAGHYRMARLWPVVGLGLVLFALAGCQTGSTLPLSAVPGVASTSPIILDADASASGYHVAWASDDQGIQYMRLDRETMTWSPTRLIKQSSAQCVAIASEGNTIHLFWSDNLVHYHRSLDGGRSWQDLSEYIATEARSIEHLAALAVGDEVHLLYGNQTTLFYRFATASGLTWDATSTLASSQSHGLGKAALEVDTWGDVHVVWPEYELDSGQGALYQRLRASQSGTWDESAPLFVSHDSRISQPSIASLGGEVIVSWLSMGMPHYLVLDKSEEAVRTVSGTWIYENGQRTFVSAACGAEAACQAWIDKQGARKEWWGYLPFYEILTAGKKNPYWADNDIYLQFLEKKSQRLTPDLSYAYTLDLVAGEEGILLFWSGQATVGKTLKESTEPSSIFWHVAEQIPRSD